MSGDWRRNGLQQMLVYEYEEHLLIIELFLSGGDYYYKEETQQFRNLGSY